MRIFTYTGVRGCKLLIRSFWIEKFLNYGPAIHQNGTWPSWADIFLLESPTHILYAFQKEKINRQRKFIRYMEFQVLQTLSPIIKGFFCFLFRQRSIWGLNSLGLISMQRMSSKVVKCYWTTEHFSTHMSLIYLTCHLLWHIWNSLNTTFALLIHCFEFNLLPNIWFLGLLKKLFT